MKHVLKTAGFAALTGFATLATAQVTSSNLMNKGSNIPVLNAQNLSDGVYTLPLPDANTTQIRMKLKGYVELWKRPASMYLSA